MHYFYKVRQKSKYPEYVGKYYGWVTAGKCKMQTEKEQPIKHYLKALGKQGIDYTEYVGICADEKDRIETLMKKKGKRSLLDENNYTQSDAKRLCADHGLLSPTYEIAKRGGCWYCPNQGIPELARLKQQHPELWNELVNLSKVENTVARGFKYGKTFESVSAEVDAYIENQKNAAMQMTIWDTIGGLNNG